MLTLVLAIHIHAETFLGVTSATNRLVVGTNEALIISSVFPTDSSFQLVKDGSIFTTIYGSPLTGLCPASPSALAGPCELIFTNTVLLNFQRVSTAAIQTIALQPMATNVITASVAVGQKIRVFNSFGYGYIKVTRGNSYIMIDTWSLSQSRGNHEFSGPLSITFLMGDPQAWSYVISYVLIDEAQAVPQGVTLQSPTGIFQLSVEKSINLTNWSPAIFQTIREDQKAYYRLNITK